MKPMNAEQLARHVARMDTLQELFKTARALLLEDLEDRRETASEEKHVRLCQANEAVRMANLHVAYARQWKGEE